MRQRWTFILLMVVCLLVLAAPSISRAQTRSAPDNVNSDLPALIYAGDSWGFFAFPQMRQHLIDAGYADNYSIINRAVPGSHASQWASGYFLRSVLRQLRPSPGNPIVIFSLGGNDFLYGDVRYSGGGLDDPIYGLIEQRLRSIVDQILAERGDTTILFVGYDILNMDKTPECHDMAVDLAGSGLPQDVNPLLVELGELQRRVADDYSQVYYADVIGALQGHPGAADMNAWSPLPYFIGYIGWQQDCIHMGQEGYGVFTGSILDRMQRLGLLSP